MRKTFKKEEGVTLLELLAVISILAILTIIGIVALNPNEIRKRARDLKRKSDLKQIQKALELYRQDQSPPAFTAVGSFPAVGNCWSSGAGCTGNVYMTNTPGDPNRNPASYYYARPTTLTYTLCACLENASDPDGANGDCDAGYDCATDRRYVLVQP